MSDGPHTDEDDFLDSLTETALYSIGAAFADTHPELVDQAIDEAAAMEDQGLAAYAQAAGVDVHVAFETLVTGLALRYYRALTG